MLEKLRKAKLYELQAWMFGAGILGFGLGLLLSDYAKNYALPVAITGAILHSWAMYKIYSKK